MPTGAMNYCNPWDSDPRRWAKCRTAVEADLKAKGIYQSHRRWHAMVQQMAIRMFNRVTH